MTLRNRNTIQAQDGQIIAGIRKNLQNVPTLALGGQTFTPTALIGLLQNRIDAANTVFTARANWLDAVKKYDALRANADVVVRGLRQYVVNTFGAKNPLLADFGFTERTRAEPTPEKKAAAVAKRAATRKARNTLGKKAKLAITGAVPSTAPTTLAVPALPAAAPVAQNPLIAPPAPARPAVATAGSGEGMVAKS